VLAVFWTRQLLVGAALEEVERSATIDSKEERIATFLLIIL